MMEQYGTKLLVAVAVLMCLYLAVPLATQSMYTEDDLGAFHIPLRYFYADALDHGESFLWMPHLFNGFYLLGEGQIGMLHPWHLFLYGQLPFETAFHLELWISYPLLLLGWFCLFRRWRISPQGAMLGALFGTFMGFPINHYIHMHFVAILAHLPWALLAIQACFDHAGLNKILAYVGLLLLSASQVLLAMPQALIFSWMVEGVFALSLFIQSKAWRVLLQLGMTKALAILLGAVQLMPLWEGLEKSYRATPESGFTLSISLHPLNLLQCFNPYLFQRRLYAPFKGDEPWDAPYFGAAAIVLLLFVVLQRHAFNRHEKRLAIFGLVLTVAGTLLALGHYGFLDPLLTHTPVLNKLRAPARFIAIAHVGMVLVVGLGFMQLYRMQQGTEPIPKRFLLLLLVIPVSLGTLVLGKMPFFQEQTHQLMPWMHQLFGVGLVCGATLLLLLAAHRQRWAYGLLIVLCLGDMALYSLRHKEAETLETYLAATPPPPDAAPGTRIDPDIHPTYMNRYVLHDLHMVYGYTALMPDRLLDYTHEIPLLLAGVQWREARELATEEVAEAYARGEDWVPVVDALPRVRIVKHRIHGRFLTEDLERIQLEDMVITHTEAHGIDGTPSTVTSWDMGPGHYTVHCSAGGGGLVIAESFHPGWVAWVNNRVTHIEPAYGDFMCVILPDEASTVELRFRPLSYERGRRLSSGAVILSLVFLVGLRMFGLNKQ